MFRRRYRHRYDRFGLGDVFDSAGDVYGRGSWGHMGFGPRPRRRRGPSWGLILLAGLASWALWKLMSAGNHSNLSKTQKTILGGLVVAVGVLLLSLQRRAMRYRW